MTSVVIDNGGPALEFDSNEIKNQEENEPVSEFPAVVVEPVPSARLEQGYAAQVLVYDDETYLMQDVAEEQEIETETVETVEASVHGSNVHCTDKTIEAAEALLHMESPTCLRDARSPGDRALAQIDQRGHGDSILEDIKKYRILGNQF